MPDFGTLLYYVWVLIVFVTMISILVAAHELGHYLFARWFKMGVEEFAIGFGKRPLFIWGRRTYHVPLPANSEEARLAREAEAKQHVDGSHVLEAKITQSEVFEAARGDGDELPEPAMSTAPAMTAEGSPLQKASVKERGRESLPFEGGSETTIAPVPVMTAEGPALRETTVFTVRPWPVGGFVRIKGMVPQDDGSEVDVPGGFYSKPPWQRLMVLLAGPLFSVLAGIMVLIPVYMYHGIERVSQEPVVGNLPVESPAYEAGLRPGDRIVRIDDQPIERFYDILRTVRFQPGREMPIEWERGGERMASTVTPVLNERETPILDHRLDFTPDLARQAVIGVPMNQELVRLDAGEATYEALYMPVKAVKIIGGIFVKPARFEQSVGGPGTMVMATGLMVQQGIGKVLWLAALLSISVGIFNLLPVPPLDGGQMAMAIAEMFRGGRRLSMQVQNLASTVGFLLVIMLMLSAIVVDVRRLTNRPAPNRPAPSAPAPETAPAPRPAPASTP
jgi:regulator of sigma E protease